MHWQGASVSLNHSGGPQRREGGVAQPLKMKGVSEEGKEEKGRQEEGGGGRRSMGVLICWATRAEWLMPLLRSHCCGAAACA